MSLLAWLGERLADYLEKPSTGHLHPPTCSPDKLQATLQAGDVLLVDGNSRISTAIKYLTQSTWSHATFCIGTDESGQCLLLEADVVKGVHVVPLSTYTAQHTRICRPVGISAEDLQNAIEFGREQIGRQYDTRNVLDLARYLIQTPPVPVNWRRSMLTLGSGDPTRAICSSLIAQIFQFINYPIRPMENGRTLKKRHYTLFVPGDFDISPYFKIVKPTLERDFDPYLLNWADEIQGSVQ